jgi:hypothetical protein
MLRIKVRSAIKTKRSSWLRMFGIMAALIAKLKVNHPLEPKG